MNYSWFQVHWRLAYHRGESRIIISLLSWQKQWWGYGVIMCMGVIHLYLYMTIIQMEQENQQLRTSAHSATIAFQAPCMNSHSHMPSTLPPSTFLTPTWPEWWATSKDQTPTSASPACPFGLATKPCLLFGQIYALIAQVRQECPCPLLLKAPGAYAIAGLSPHKICLVHAVSEEAEPRHGKLIG